ncbi:MAG: NUDIX hydrolase [Promethearchaeota archaeon]
MAKQSDDFLMKLKHDLRKYPVRPHVGVGGVVIYDNKLLLIKRKFEPDAGKWAIPGGHLKLGEKTKDGAEREILEETGIKVKAKSLAGVVDKIQFDENDKIVFHYVLVNYNCEIIDERFDNGIPPLMPLDDAEDINFVPLDMINNYDITESLRELLIEMKILQS